jgi:hypothetical protein
MRPVRRTVRSIREGNHDYYLGDNEVDDEFTRRSSLGHRSDADPTLSLAQKLARLRERGVEPNAPIRYLDERTSKYENYTAGAFAQSPHHSVNHICVLVERSRPDLPQCEKLAILRGSPFNIANTREPVWFFDTQNRFTYCTIEGLAASPLWSAIRIVEALEQSQRYYGQADLAKDYKIAMLEQMGISKDLLVTCDIGEPQPLQAQVKTLATGQWSVAAIYHAEYGKPLILPFIGHG